MSISYTFHFVETIRPDVWRAAKVCMMSLLVKRPQGHSALHFVASVLGDGFRFSPVVLV